MSRASPPQKRKRASETYLYLSILFVWEKSGFDESIELTHSFSIFSFVRPELVRNPTRPRMSYIIFCGTRGSLRIVFEAMLEYTQFRSSQEETLIRAITFDFWDTIVRDESDEPKRAAQGLPTKLKARYQLLSEELKKANPALTDKQLRDAFDHANDWFLHNWKKEHFTPTVRQRLAEAYHYLGMELSSGFGEVVASWERMEIITPPELAPGIEAALKELSQTCMLGIISDTIVTPGWGLRQILMDFDLAKYFRVFIYSDEVGAAKPQRKVFDEAAKRFNVPLENMAHVGDREANDIAGPNPLGVKSILYTGVIDRDSANTKASAICTHYSQLPVIIASFH